jgi:hypothetical protein
MSEDRGLPFQFFDKHFLAYVKTLELRARLQIGDDVSNQQLIDKMIDIEAKDKLEAQQDEKAE